MENVTDVQDRIVLAACTLMGRDGWTRDLLRQAAIQEGFTEGHVHMVFPGGLPDALNHFSAWADRQMLLRLSSVDTQDLGIRGRIHLAVMTRWDVLTPYRNAIAAATPSIIPWRIAAARKSLWQTADTIWTWAGDASTDYNFYTKRTLLAGVLAVSTPVWLKQDREATAEFLSRRLDNVVNVGRTISQTIGPILQKCQKRTSV